MRKGQKAQKAVKVEVKERTTEEILESLQAQLEFDMEHVEKRTVEVAEAREAMKSVTNTIVSNVKAMAGALENAIENDDYEEIERILKLGHDHAWSYANDFTHLEGILRFGHKEIKQFSSFVEKKKQQIAELKG